jgi:YidC/Oxa1 family membrane protein insertase
MDRKTILVLIAAFAALFAWQALIPKFFPPIPVPQATNGVVTVTNVAGTNVPVIAPAPAQQPIPPVPAVPTPIAIATNETEQLEHIETADAIYTFTSYGGGLKRIYLKRYLETVGCERPQGTNQVATLNDPARAPVLALQAEGTLGDNLFKLTRADDGIIAEKTLPSGLRVVKRFQTTKDYQLRASVRFENTTGEPIALPAQQVSVGTATPMSRRDDETRMGVFWFNGEEPKHVENSYFANTGCFSREPRPLYSSGPARVLWGAVHNQFFAIAVVPGTNAVAQQFTTYRIDLPRPTEAELAADPKSILDPHGLEALLGYGALTIPANQAVERDYKIYAGPKQARLLSSVGRQTGAIMDFGFFSGISKLMLRMMNGIHRVVAPAIPERLGDYAVALIIMTVIIKLVFWQLTAASTRSMKRMQALQPQMKAIQEKYKDDPAKMNKKMMEFWREHKVNPMSGCWPMLIQLPIFFALFQMIPNAIELRGEPFLWACDLSKQDTIFLLPGLNFPVNPLPLLMGATMFWQARLAPPAPGMDPTQQAMMKYMPLIFLVFLYNQPAGLTLYWTVQNLLSILQTKLTKTQEEPVAAKPSPVTPPPKKKK